MKRTILSAITMIFAILICKSELANAQEHYKTSIQEVTASIGNQKVHYLRAGSGPKTVVLLHGWPESSYMWKKMMPIFASGNEYTIIAPDLRGVNGSSAPSEEFDKASLAEDIHKLMNHLNRKHITLIGHDIGGMVAYAYTRLYPEEILGTAILDVPLPGIGSWEKLMTTEHVWHFRFHNQKPLAENLVMGRQKIYFRYFFQGHTANEKAVDNKAINAYSRAYNTKAKLNAGFEWYRAFANDELFNKSHKDNLDMPFLLVGAEYSMKDSLEEMKDSLFNLGISHIKTKVIMGSGHYIVEEKADETAKIIRDFINEVKSDKL